MKTILKSLTTGVLLALALPTMGADDAVQNALAHPERSATDRERDLRDKPAEVLALAGIKPGMTVADLFSGGGYYTEVLAHLVGPNGKVYAVNNLPYAQYSKKDREARYTEGRLGNVEHRLVEASYINLPARSVDAVVIVMSFHDAFWIDEKEGWPEIDTAGFIDSIKRMLKPGGRLLIVDHNAAAGTGAEMAGKAHRLNEEFAKQSLTSRGFKLVKTWDGLRNPDDQLDKMVFDPAVRGKTDRYVHLYQVK